MNGKNLKDYLTIEDAYVIASSSIQELEKKSGKLSKECYHIAVIYNSHILLNNKQLQQYDDYIKFQEDYLVYICQVIMISNNGMTNNEVVNFLLEELNIAKKMCLLIDEGTPVPQFYPLYYDVELKEFQYHQDIGKNFNDGWWAMYWRICDLVNEKIGPKGIF